MCGITGIYSPGAMIKQPALSAITKVLHHRSLDNSGAQLLDYTLTRKERESINVGFEYRESLLDHKLTELVAGITSKHKNGKSKYILKKVLERHLLRKLFHRKKMGVSFSLKLLAQRKLLLIHHYLSKGIIKRDGIFNSEAMLERVDKFYNNEI